MRRSTVAVVACVLVALGACVPLAQAPSAPPGTTSGTPRSTSSGAPATAPALSPTPGALTAGPATASPTAATTASPSPNPPSTPLAPTGQVLAWREVAPAAAPPGREDHTWTVSGGGEVAYLFGGRAARTDFNDLWRYDLATDEWIQLRPAGPLPAPRFGHTAVWVEGVGLVVWSGQAGTSFFSDVWAYDPLADAWRELPAVGDVPPARYGSCAAVGPDGRMWVSHGFTEDTGRFSDTRAYDFDSGEWSNLTSEGVRPVERCLHDCLWTPDGRLLIYAGQATGAPAIGDLWTYRPAGDVWTQAPQPAPQARQLYALAQLDGTAYVFGGGAADGSPLGDIWLLDLADLDWTQPAAAGPAPPPRTGATLIADVAADRLLLFGGRQRDGELDDLWELSPAP